MKFLTIFLFVVIGSCAPNHLKISAKTSKIGLENGFETKTYQTKKFKIFTLQKISPSKSATRKTLRIYFEGDGKAFINRNLASSNPTPTSYFLVNLLLEDPAENIVYIARPCQFVDDTNCQEKYWTNARFAKEILDAVDEVVRKFGDFDLELIGYSGGAEIAKYVATKNKNTLNLRTIAGNLDHKKFCETHKVTPLDQSFDDSEILQNLADIPQIHFIGNDDKIILPIISKSYADKLSKKSCVKIISVDKASHFNGWKNKWSSLLQTQPSCSKD